MKLKSLSMSPTAIGLSFAVHAAVLAGVLTLAWREPAAPPPVVSVEIIVTAPGGEGERPRHSPPPGAAEGSTSRARADLPPPLSEAAAPDDLSALQPTLPVPSGDDGGAEPQRDFEIVEAAAGTVAGLPPVTDDDDVLVVPPAAPKPASLGMGAKMEPKAQAPPATEVAAATPSDPAKSTLGSAARPLLAVPAIGRPPAPGGGEDAATGLTSVAAAPGNPLPDYPFVARRKGLEGKVVLRVAVLPSGAPASVTVETSSKHGILDRAALKTVERWRFIPATRFGQPVEAVVRVPVTFKLEE